MFCHGTFYVVHATVIHLHSISVENRVQLAGFGGKCLSIRFKKFRLIFDLTFLL